MTKENTQTQPPPSQPTANEPERTRTERAKPYGSTLLGMVCRIESVYPDAAEQLERVVAQYLNSAGMSLTGACWDAVAEELGLKFELADLEENAEFLKTFHAMHVGETWLDGFIRSLAYWWQNDHRITPEDVLWSLRSKQDEFMMQIENARHILRDYPEIVAEDVRKAIAGQPELFTGKEGK